MISLDEYRALLAGAGVMRRDDRGRLVLRGADRLSYLHGLLTNDIDSLRSGGGRYAALLTAQGRMLTDMRLFELDDRTLIDLDVSLAPSIRDHFDRFIITEDVVVEDATTTSEQVGVYGPDASRIVDEVRKVVMDAPSFAVSSNDLGVEGFDVIGPVGYAEAFIETAKRIGAMPVSRDIGELTRVEAGIPRFLIDMDTTTIPLEAGIEDRAISMTKGCYVGQEVIVRVLHRGGGRVAKRLVGLTLEKAAARGDKLATGDREVGVITSAVESPRFGPIALGYVQRDFTALGTDLSAQTAEGEVRARVTPLPFVSRAG
jgi:tRNA-modifying protein YgfZ